MFIFPVDLVLTKLQVEMLMNILNTATKEFMAFMMFWFFISFKYTYSGIDIH